MLLRDFFDRNDWIGWECTWVCYWWVLACRHERQRRVGGETIWLMWLIGLSFDFTFRVHHRLAHYSSFEYYTSASISPPPSASASPRAFMFLHSCLTPMQLLSTPPLSPPFLTTTPSSPTTAASILISREFTPAPAKAWLSTISIASHLQKAPWS